jgi:two-component system, sensor histidine kinase and response regulator
MMSGENRLVHSDALLGRFVDLPDLLARVEDDRDLLRELFVIFREELPGLHGALHAAIDMGDLSQAAKAAHTLKGMLANMSMKRGASIAADVEMAARSGHIPALKRTLASFDSEIAELSAAVCAFIHGS